MARSRCRRHRRAGRGRPAAVHGRRSAMARPGVRGGAVVRGPPLRGRPDRGAVHGTGHGGAGRRRRRGGRGPVRPRRCRGRPAAGRALPGLAERMRTRVLAESGGNPLAIIELGSSRLAARDGDESDQAEQVGPLPSSSTAGGCGAVVAVPRPVAVSRRRSPPSSASARGSGPSVRAASWPPSASGAANLGAAAHSPC